MTPFETALRLMRSKTTTGDPDFVVAYLRAELDKTWIVGMRAPTGGEASE